MSDDAPRPAIGPFHPGEQAVQSRLGVRDTLERIGQRVIRDFMPEQHRFFFTNQPLMITGGLDGDGQPWASALHGAPGFIQSPDPYHLSIKALPAADDPLAGHFRTGTALGLLGIEFATRRRNRVNGTITVLGPEGFTLTVGQSFGNCPQYIPARPSLPVPPDLPPVSPLRFGADLPPEAMALIRRTDSFFIASAVATIDPANPAAGADVSHRGGRPGFVDIAETTGGVTLTIPDYAGNNFFNTLGNLAVNPRAGLLIPDPATGDLLHLAGTTEMVWDGPEVEVLPGAHRLIRFAVTGGLWRPGALPLRWAPPPV